jgi:hypothetical protein
VGKSTPHPGKKILQGKSTTLAGHLHSKHHHQNKNETKKKAQAGFLHPSRQKKFAQLGNYKAPQQAKNKTKPPRQGKSTTLAGKKPAQMGIEQLIRQKTAQMGCFH